MDTSLGKVWHFNWYAGTKAHFVPNIPSLVEGIEQDLAERGMAEDARPLLDNDPVTEAWLDCPGMISMDRTWWEFTTSCGYKLKFPTLDFHTFHGQVNHLASPVRTAPNGAQYHKLHGWRHCIVLTPTQFNELEVAMNAAAPAVEEKADAEHQEFMARLHKARSASGGAIGPSQREFRRKPKPIDPSSAN